MESSGSDSTFDEEETQREFDEAIAGDDDYDFTKCYTGLIGLFYSP